jgi:diaminopimelate decarboxylase
MHYFAYKKNELYCEGISLRTLAEKFGTPLYVYSSRTVVEHLEKIQKAFAPVKPLICYAMKANSNLAIVKMLVDRGAGLDIVSGGELFLASKASCPGNRIVYASVGKTDKEISEAIDKKILMFNVESIPELEKINEIAADKRTVVNVALRVNPNVAASTHKYISTGKMTNKFGIDLDTAAKILAKASKFSNIAIKGLHIHIGSQISQSTPFVKAIKKMVKFIAAMAKKNIKIEYLDIGGGLGIIYNKETPQTADEFASKVIPLLKNSGLKLILEPGRFIVGNAGILVTKVVYVKKTPYKQFVIVNGAMNDLIRPALYDAYHEILPIDKIASRKKVTVDVVGPVCESGDFFAKNRDLAQANEGEYLAVMGAGAYGFSMSSNYNSRLRAAEVMVKNDKAYLVRKREAYEDLIMNEVMVQL